MVAAFCSNFAIGQISEGGEPLSFKSSESFSEISYYEITKPDMEKIRIEDEKNALNDDLYLYGRKLPVNLSIDNAGEWTDLPDGDRVWRMKLYSEDALALFLLFDDFWLPTEGRLFVYGGDKKQVIGAFTEFNNRESGLFATELIFGEVIVLEYFEPQNVRNMASINISSLGYAYRSVNFLRDGKSFGDSEVCEVNINCVPEGDDWQDEKRGVARISVVTSQGFGWCSGSLINTTLEDGTPYFLTADHCAEGTSTEDLEQWTFYFNFEATACTSPTSQPSYNSMVGGTKIARGGESGSDFYLILLNNYVPMSFTPFFNGWDRSAAPPTGGVGIHHPAGDIKKISKFNSATSGGWLSNNTHWRLSWETTQNGHGVTEGGSSGSPLFNNSGYIVGTLTGGASACVAGGAGTGTGPDKADYYGKFYYSWSSNGSQDYSKLKPWLDPSDSGVTTVNGKDGYDNIQIQADFISDLTSIYPGESVEFTDISNAFPGYSRKWNFEGGSPESSVMSTKSVTYDNPGVFSVSLTINSYQGDDTLTDVEIKTNYITVIDTSTSSMNELDMNGIIIYPNPATNYINVSSERDFIIESIRIFNATGELVRQKQNNLAKNMKIELGNLPAGIYNIFLINDKKSISSKFSLLR